jgi:integrase
VAQYLGLRVSEILALQWSDINFGELTMRVTRGGVDGVVDEVKTEYSEDELPLDPDLARYRAVELERAMSEIGGGLDVS